MSGRRGWTPRSALPILLSALVGGVLLWRARMRGRGTAGRAALQPARLTEVERRAVQRRIGHGDLAPLAADLALADRYDRYAG